jgi:hypothetical protein
MAKAKRHYISGYIWHITHRRHKREFLLKFSEDRHRKALLGYWAKGRDIIEGTEGYQVPERPVTYNALFGVEKGDIGPQNAYFWDINAE